MSAEHDERVKLFVSELEHFIEVKYQVLESLKAISTKENIERRRRLLRELANDRKELTDSISRLTWAQVEFNPIPSKETK